MGDALLAVWRKLRHQARKQPSISRKSFPVTEAESFLLSVSTAEDQLTFAMAPPVNRLRGVTVKLLHRK